MTNIMTALNKCFTENSAGEVGLKVSSTSGDNEKLENVQSKLRKSIDTTNNRVRVVSTS
jgi:hypothetical protein